MSSLNASVDVQIIGGGPVGLACAAWCLQKFPELSLHLIDRNPQNDSDIVASDTRGIALSHGSKLLLDTIQAWPNDSCAIHSVHVSHVGQFGRALMTRDELGQEALGHIVRYRGIHLALREALRQLQKKAPHFVWQHTGSDNNQDQDQDHSRARCIVHAEGGLFTQQDWVESGRDYQQSALVGLVEVENAHFHYAWERFTSQGPLALLPSHHGSNVLNMVWCSSPATAERLNGISDADFLDEIQSTFGSRVGQFKSIRDRRLYPLGLNYRKDIVQGNEVWIGNAAQALHPVAGQGLNLGLRDAYLLAEQLSGLFSKQTHATKSRNAIDNALFEYSTSRQADRKATIGITDFLARVFTSPLTPVIAARGAALSLLQWLPPIKTGLARQMMFGRR
jgi:2-octaprenyl-6-methoxyphenol hydroxylase